MEFKKAIYAAKQNKTTVKITIIGNHEYTGVITDRIKNNLKLTQSDGTEKILIEDSIIAFHALEKAAISSTDNG